MNKKWIASQIRDHLLAVVGLVVIGGATLLWAKFNERWMACAVAVPLTREIQWDAQSGAFKERTVQDMTGYALFIANRSGNPRDFVLDCPNIERSKILGHRYNASTTLVGGAYPNGQWWDNRLRIDALQVAADDDVSVVVLGASTNGVTEPKLLCGKSIVESGELVSRGDVLIAVGISLMMGCVLPFVWRLIVEYFQPEDASSVSERLRKVVRKHLANEKMSEEVFAERAGVDEQALHSFINGQPAISIIDLDRIGETLGLRLNS